MCVKRAISLFNDLGRNLASGLKLAVFSQIDQSELRLGIEHVLILGMLCLIVDCVHDYFFAIDGWFVFDGIIYGVYFLVIQFFGIFLFSLYAVSKQKILPLFAGVLSIHAVISAFFMLFALIGITDSSRWYVQPHEIWFWIFSLWVYLSVFQLVSSLYPLKLELAAIAGVIYLLVILTPSFLWGAPDRYWYAPSKDFEDSYSVLSDEKVFYLQDELLTESFQNLSPGKPGVDDLYFVGFAGYAFEDVFKDEVLYLRDMFERKFNANGKTVELINNIKTFEEIPMATETSLRKTFNKIGEIANSDDIVFLYLTSHGSKEHELSVKLSYYELRDIGPLTLKNLFEEAGIKWRVIVVSACYSGGFIEQLSDPYTLIMTASSADRESFGCGKDSDFTYFGDALFRKALNEERSFIKAFDIAKKIIEEREKSEEKRPSNPQIFVGDKIAKKLERLERRE